MQGLKVVIIVFGGIFVVGYLLEYLFSKTIKCPHCNQKGHSKRVDEISLGSNFRKGDMQKYRVYYECENCNYKWSSIEERDESVD